MDRTIRSGTAADLKVAVRLWEEAQSILEVGGRAIGVALFSPARENSGTGKIIPGLAHISSVAVKPTYWGRGLGKFLMNAVVEEIKIGGYESTQLWTQPDNLRAVSLYASLGFETTGEEKYFEDERIIRYLLRLVN